MFCEKQGWPHSYRRVGDLTDGMLVFLGSSQCEWEKADWETEVGQCTP